MARNGVREQLLAEERARRRAAGQKVSRLKHRGVDTSGIDPRRPSSDVQGMSTRQLRSYVNRLNSFTSRSSGYVPGMRGTPISSSLWRQYVAAEKINNANAERFYNSIRNLNVPGTGMTVEGRLNDRRSRENGPREGDYRSFGEFKRTVAGVTSEQSLKRLLKQMQKRNAPEYLEREARLQRRIVNKMLRRTGNKDLLPLIKDMSDEELITLAQYTDFMPALAGSYAMAKSTSSDSPRYQSSVYEDNEEKVHDLVEWAHQHFSDKEESEQDADATPRNGKRVSFTPGTGNFNPVVDGATGVAQRDRFGRFARAGESKPDPTFARDERGRFAPGSGKFNPKLK